MTTHVVAVTSEGSFEPRRVRIREGDTVEWRFAEPTDCILPVDVEDRKPVPRAYDPDDPHDFTGPLPRLVPGIHCINQPRQADQSGDHSLPAWVWNEPGFACVYIRLNWQLVNPQPGVYDWSTLTPHMDAAVASGKFFGVSLRAGVQETPAWLFDGRLGAQKCHPIKLPGIARTLGAPHDPNYQHWWFEVHKALAEHIKSNNAWWQRFTAVRISGANYHSAEARLPHSGDKDKPRSDEWNGIWQQAGYSPAGLYGFYAAQGDLLREAMPGKDICYPLIQSGFPNVNAADPAHPPTGVEQTVDIINSGRARWGTDWVVQHLGLQALRQPPNTLPHSGSHPVTTTKGVKVGDGNPNQWALRAGIAGSPTAGQTVNRLRPGTDDLERALTNAWKNSDYIWVEVYDKDVKPSYDAGSGPIGPSGRTLKDWSDRFTDWRRDRWDATLGDPFPMVHRHTFTGLVTGQKLYYVHGHKDGSGLIKAV
jgi:hypothetical protein